MCVAVVLARTGLLMLAVFWGAPVDPVRAESVIRAFTLLNHFTVTGQENQPGGFQQSITTHNEVIYVVWVDSDFRTVIAQIPPSGDVKTAVIFAVTDKDPYHNVPVVGVDKHGYIHVVGNMHNSPYGRCQKHRTRKAANPCYPNDNAYYDHAWQYMVSDKPEDISSFSFHGGDAMSPPGTWITYPYFARDHNKELFLSFRHRVRFGAWVPGTMALGLARYDADKRRWIALGGRNYEHGEDKAHPLAGRSLGKTLFWEKYRRRQHGLSILPIAHVLRQKQQNAHRLWHQRRHQSRQQSTELHHVRLFRRWRRDVAALRRHALPILAYSPGHGGRGGVESVSARGGYWGQVYIGVGPSGHPIMTFATAVDFAPFITTLQPGRGWSRPVPVKAGFARMITDQNGVMTTIFSSGLLRSRDAGKTWTEIRIGGLGNGFRFVFDEQYHQETGRIRFFDYNKGINTLIEQAPKP